MQLATAPKLKLQKLNAVLYSHQSRLYTPQYPRTVVRHQGTPDTQKDKQLAEDRNTSEDSEVVPLQHPRRVDSCKRCKLSFSRAAKSTRRRCKHSCRMSSAPQASVHICSGNQCLHVLANPCTNSPDKVQMRMTHVMEIAKLLFHVSIPPGLTLNSTLLKISFVGNQNCS